MGGSGSGGSRSAGKLALPVRSYCEFCRRRFQTRRRNRRFCDDHRRPAHRARPALPLVLAQAVAALARFDEQFAPVATVREIGARARMELEQLARDSDGR